jgi:predicted membrane protein
MRWLVIYRSNSNLGCLAAVIAFLIIFMIFRFSWIVIFKTPVGWVLLAYILYRYISKRYRINKAKNEFTEAEEHPVDQSEEIEVEYEDYD